MQHDPGDEVLQDVLSGEGDRDAPDAQGAQQRAHLHPEEVEGVQGADAGDHDTEEAADGPPYVPVALPVDRTDEHPAKDHGEHEGGQEDAQ